MKGGAGNVLSSPSESVPYAKRSCMRGRRTKISSDGSIGVSHVRKKRLVPVNAGVDSDSILVNFFTDHIGFKCFGVPEVLSSAGGRC